MRNAETVTADHRIGSKSRCT